MFEEHQLTSEEARWREALPNLYSNCINSSIPCVTYSHSRTSINYTTGLQHSASGTDQTATMNALHNPADSITGIEHPRCRPELGPTLEDKHH